MSALVVAAGWIASRIAGPAIGSLVLLAGSFAIMVPTFRREWRLGWITSLLPPICAGVSYAVQLAFMDQARINPPEEWILPVLVLGLWLGWLRGRTHQVFARDGSIFARRSSGYLVLWVACFAIAQVFALARARQLLEYALLGGAFSTAMLLAVAIVLLRKRAREMAVIASAAVLAVVIAGTGEPLVQAQSDLCDLIPQWQGSPGRVGRVQDSRGNITALIGCVSFARNPVRSLHVGRADAEDVAQQVFATFRSQAEGNVQSVALGDEAWETPFDVRHDNNGNVTYFRPWARMIRLGAYVSIANAEPDGMDEIARLQLEMLQRVEALQGGGFAPPALDLSPAEESRQESWTEPLLPRGEIAFLDDFGSDPASVAAMEATAIASIALIFTCIGLTVSESMTEVASRINPDALKKVFVDSSKLIDWDGEEVPIQDGSGRYGGGEIGQVWYDGGWMDRKDADALVRQRTAERQAEIARREREREAFEEESAQVSDGWMERKRLEGEEEEARLEAQRAVDVAARARARADLTTLHGRLTRDDMDLDTRLEALDLAADGNLEGLRDLYRAALQDQIDSGIAEARAALRTARIARIGEMGSKAVVGYAKAQLAVLGGPFGAPVVLGATGLISGAGEGAESYVAGDSGGRVAAKTLAGFLSGVKDGAATMIANVPGASAAVKMLVPASADGAETFARTGDLGQAAQSAGISVVTDLAGNKIDAGTTGASRELARAGLSSGVGGVSSVVAGGSFGDGAMDALASHAGARVGAHHGSEAAIELGGAPDTRNDAAIRAVLDAPKAAGPRPPIMDELSASRHNAVVIGPDGKVVTKPDGSEITKPYVNAKKALEQLADPASSRWLKNGPKPLQQAVLNTREDQIYGPANATTIAKAVPRLEAAGELQPGDRVVMKGFSTPGKPPSVGADRDARLLIERDRFNRVTGKVDVIQIEVDRKHWEGDAYKDFYDHTTKIAGPITPETQPGFFKRVDELSYLKKAGLSDEQIRHRAWAEDKNQLFTDRRHIEASRDNQDQTIRIRQTRDGIDIERQQITPRVQNVQGGGGRLVDPQGAGNMWVEKPRIYVEHIPSEAIAQTQKGIEALIKTREGYLQQGLQPPPINDTMASAMKIIAATPMDTAATPQVIAQVTRDLNALGFRSLDDALVRIGHQHELLAQSRPITYQPGTLSASDFARIASAGVTKRPTGGGTP